MKKIFAFILAMVMLTACIPGYAATTDLTAATSETQVSVSGNMGTKYANKPVTILLVKSTANPANLQDSDIKYIAETKANANGAYSAIFNATEPAACTVYVKCGNADVTNSVLSASAKVTYDMSIDVSLGQTARASFTATNPFGATVETDDTALLMVAFYSAENELLDFVSEEYTVKTNEVFRIVKDCPKGTAYAKAMLWKDLTSLEALHEDDIATDITEKAEGNILVIGCSFSVDSIAYVHEIAENLGYDINIHHLQVDGTVNKEAYDVIYDDITNGGGAYWGYEYKGSGAQVAKPAGFDSRTRYEWKRSNGSVKPAAVASWKWKLTDITDEVDFDAVIVQNYWGMGENLVNADWNPGRDTDIKWYPEIIKLIQKLEPNAEFMISSVWVNEMGYLSSSLNSPAVAAGFDNSDFGVQSYAYDQIEKLNGQAAIDIGEIVNPDKSPIRQLPTGYAFQLARNWQDPETGDYKFRTQYHQFTEQDDGKYLPMSEKDTAAGRMRLNRDGFHASFAARYLAGLVWVEVLTGADVRNCTYIPPEGTWQLSAIDSATGDTLNYKVTVKFPELTEEEADIFQDIAHQAVKNFKTRGLDDPSIPFTFDK